MKASVLTHFAVIIIITGIMMTIYATVQQAHRSAANDPQIQIARDISDCLGSQKSIEPLLPKDTINIAKSLGVFVTLYDTKGDPVTSTGLLDGHMPELPPGVLDVAKANGEDAVTWQPRAGVRQAIVVESVASSTVGYVAVGRSLHEVEVREANLVWIVFIAWILCLATILVHLVIQIFTTRRSSKKFIA